MAAIDQFQKNFNSKALEKDDHEFTIRSKMLRNCSFNSRNYLFIAVYSDKLNLISQPHQWIAKEFRRNKLLASRMLSNQMIKGNV